jgi:ribonuclease HIII
MDRGCDARGDLGRFGKTSPAKAEPGFAVSRFQFSVSSSGASACGDYDNHLRSANFVTPLTSYTCKLTDEQAATLKSWLEARNYEFREIPYARFAAEKEKTNVVFYESGKLVVQGKGTQEFVEFVLEPEILKQKLIRETPGCITTVVPIGNEAYNRLHAKMKSVNTVLAWGHARVIENLMGQKHRMNPPPVRAISDQFASSKTVIENAMMSLGRQIELVQKHRAEEDLSVAAASILARDEFVKRLAALEKAYATALPKGASSAVDAAAKEFLNKHGVESLSKVAKMHFRTSLRAQGLPEPAKVEWRGSGRSGGTLKKNQNRR